MPTTDEDAAQLTAVFVCLDAGNERHERPDTSRHSKRKLSRRNAVCFGNLEMLWLGAIAKSAIATLALDWAWLGTVNDALRHDQ